MTAIPRHAKLRATMARHSSIPVVFSGLVLLAAVARGQDYPALREATAVATNLVETLGRRLQLPCRALRGDVKILAADSVRYPDAIVTCSPFDDRSDIVPNPAVVFEVLSRSTASLDRLAKNVEYQVTPSIQRYVMIEQSRMGATVFARDGANWVSLILIGDTVLAMPEIGVEFPLSEIYKGVEFRPPDLDD